MSVSHILQESIFTHIEQNNTAKFFELIDSDSSLCNIAENHGRLPLHVAAASGDGSNNLQIVRKLAKTSPETVNMKTKHGFTPVYMAAMKGNADVSITFECEERISYKKRKTTD